MPRAARIIAILCFIGFVLFFLNSQPRESIVETTPEPDEIDRGLWILGALLVWLAASAAAVFHGFCELFICDEFRLRRGPLITMCLALPGIVYFLYALTMQNT